jgi:hypothetical protein
VRHGRVGRKEGVMGCKDRALGILELDEGWGTEVGLGVGAGVVNLHESLVVQLRLKVVAREVREVR